MKKICTQCSCSRVTCKIYIGKIMTRPAEGRGGSRPLEDGTTGCCRPGQNLLSGQRWLEEGTRARTLCSCRHFRNGKCERAVTHYSTPYTVYRAPSGSISAAAPLHIVLSTGTSAVTIGALIYRIFHPHPPSGDQ